MSAYDPAANETAARAASDTAIDFAIDARSAAERADVVVIATPWDEFRDAGNYLGADGRPRVVVDCWRVVDPTTAPSVVEVVPLGTAYAAERVATT